MPRWRWWGSRLTLAPRPAALALRGAAHQARSPARVQAAPPAPAWLAGLTSQPGGASSVPAAWVARPPARSPLPADPQLLPTTVLPRWPSALSGGAAERPNPAKPGPRPAPALRRLRSVAPGGGPAATARPGRTRRCESRARTTAPTEPRGAARPEASGGVRRARQSGSCSYHDGRQRQPRLAASRGLPTSRAAPPARATGDGRAPGPGQRCVPGLARSGEEMHRGRNWDYSSQEALRGRNNGVSEYAPV